MISDFKKRLLTSLWIIPLTLFFIFKGSIFFIFFLSLIFFISVYEWFNITKNLKVFKIAGTILIILSIYSAYLIRENQGANTFIFIILISVLTDLGGYIFGKTLRGPKLTKISPNKTYSGMIGSYILSLLFAYTLFNKYIYIDKIIIMSLLIATVTQAGDLLISYLKRKANIKDTGVVLPGHGGLLDRFDGIIFAIPFGLLINIFL